MAAYARRWPKERVMTAGPRHRAQGQEGGKAVRATTEPSPQGSDTRTSQEKTSEGPQAKTGPTSLEGRTWLKATPHFHAISK
ncbi:hypothetical protein HPG69_015104 [Diceros bicornis minor]|uniref:Uncharacterized protein n=1 Tax=Diceros bicornis minor TaxID=77932 RepID=A0A7J7FKR1_DICBM|nr:hypothetical protein HPG69_015104 [Diceros bicornis minor]